MKLHERVHLLTIRDEVAIRMMAALVSQPHSNFKDEAWFLPNDSLKSMWARAYAVADGMEKASI